MDEMPTGQLIKVWRIDRKLSTVGLATHAGITVRYLEMIEAGTKTPSLPVLRKLAKALRVRTSALVGELASEDHNEPVTFQLSAVERALYTFPKIALTERNTPPEMADLKERIETAWTVWTDGPDKYSFVLGALPDLIVDVELAVSGYGSREAYRQACEVYHLARAVTKHAGRADLGRMIVERTMRYAEATEDPAVIGLAHWNLAQALLSGDMAEGGLDICMRAVEKLEPVLGDGGSPLWSVYGGLLQTGAVAAARTGDLWKGKTMLRGPASRAATRVGPGRNHHHLAFGPANVAIHAVSVAGEVGETSEALRLADEVDISDTGLSLERKTTHLYQVARAHEVDGNDTAVLVHLQMAERMSPQDFTYKRNLRSMVATLVRRARPSYANEVRGFASRIGVLSET